MRIRQKWIKGILTVIFGICAATSVYPLLWMLINSFKDTSEIMTGESFGLPHVWKFANYTDAIFNRDILKFFLNSIIVTGFTLLLTVTAAIMLSYALTRMQWKLSVHVSKMVTLGILLPSQILTISAFNIAMATLMCSSFLSGIPLEMEEAAVMDGAGIFTILFRVIVPMIKPAVATMCINTFINSWNEFIYALVLISGEKYRTLPIALMNYSSGKYGTDYGGMYAAMVITSILPVLLFVFFSNQVEKTFSAGAILK